MATFEHTDATFNTSVPPATLTEPTLFLMSFASFALSAGLGQDHTFDASLSSNLLIVWGVNTPVSTHLVGRSAKALDMVIEAGQPLLIIVGVSFQHLPASDDTAIDFIQPDLASELGWFARFLSPDDRGMRFEQTHTLILLITYSLLTFVSRIKSPHPGQFILLAAALCVMTSPTILENAHTISFHDRPTKARGLNT